MDVAEIYRSRDAITLGSKIGELPLAGNSAIDVDYAFVDEGAGSGDAYYRVKYIDITEKEYYSKPAIIGASCALTEEKLKVYPNPNPGNFNLSIDVKNNAKYTIDILDVLSRLVHTTDRDLYTGNNFISINMNQYDDPFYDGIYQLILMDVEGNVLSKQNFILEN